MKIGITGAHSTGKTTLLNALREIDRFKDFEFCVEVTRWVHSLGFDINENGSGLVQELVMLKHVYNMFMHEKSISDRAALDALVYSIWLNRNGRLDDETLAGLYKDYHKLAGEYDILFYIRPEFKIEDDGVRSTDVVWQKEIAAIFEELIKKFNIEVILLTGSVEERVNTFIKEIENYERD